MFKTVFKLYTQFWVSIWMLIAHFLLIKNWRKLKSIHLILSFRAIISLYCVPWYRISPWVHPSYYKTRRRQISHRRRSGGGGSLLILRKVVGGGSFSAHAIGHNNNGSWLIKPGGEANRERYRFLSIININYGRLAQRKSMICISLSSLCVCVGLKAAACTYKAPTQRGEYKSI